MDFRIFVDSHLQNITALKHHLKAVFLRNEQAHLQIWQKNCTFAD